MTWSGKEHKGGVSLYWMEDFKGNVCKDLIL